MNPFVIVVTQSDGSVTIIHEVHQVSLDADQVALDVDGGRITIVPTELEDIALLGATG